MAASYEPALGQDSDEDMASTSLSPNQHGSQPHVVMSGNRQFSTATSAAATRKSMHRREGDGIEPEEGEKGRRDLD